MITISYTLLFNTIGLLWVTGKVFHVRLILISSDATLADLIYYVFELLFVFFTIVCTGEYLNSMGGY